MADAGRIMDACHPFWGSPPEDILKMTEDTEYCPQISCDLKSMSAPAAAPTASAPGALGDAVAPPAQNVVAPPRVFVLFLHALDVTPGCTRIRGGGM